MSVPTAQRAEPRRERSLAAIFRAPLLHAALSGFGLVAALLGEGIWHVAAWLALAMSPASIAWFWLRAR